jgi:cytochrome P450
MNPANPQETPQPRELPGPRGWPLLGTFIPFLTKDLLQPFAGLVERYGPLFQVHLPFGHRLVMVAHPVAAEQVLRSRRGNYIKGSVYDGARILLGQGLVTSEGELWRRQRQLANPAFRPAKLERYLEVMSDCATELADEWQSRDDLHDLDLNAEMTRLTLAIVGRTLFGLDLSKQSGDAGAAFSDALVAIGRRGPSSLQLPLWVPTRANLRFRRVLRKLDGLVYEIIRRFRAGEAQNAEQTLLGAYLDSRDEQTGQGMSDRQLRDEVITLYLAGHETTSSLLTWALYMLARHPETAARATAEVDSLPTGRVPTLEQLKSLQFTSQVINETLRLYPPAWTIARNSLRQDTILGYRIPAGAIVMIAPYFIHRQDAFWPDPSRFDPDRFATAQSDARNDFAYLPFSLGPRICIGMQFSLYEARLIMSILLRRFEFHADGAEIGCQAAGTLRPAAPIRVSLGIRQARTPNQS